MAELPLFLSRHLKTKVTQVTVDLVSKGKYGKSSRFWKLVSYNIWVRDRGWLPESPWSSSSKHSETPVLF